MELHPRASDKFLKNSEFFRRMSGFTYDNPCPSYGPNLMLEPKHMAINVDVDVAHSKATLAVEIVVHCNNPNGRTLVLNGIGTFSPFYKK